MNFLKIFKESNNPLFQKINHNYIKNIFKKQYGLGGKEYCNPSYYEKMYEGENMDNFLKEFDEFLDNIQIDGDNLILYRGLHLKSKKDLNAKNYGVCWTINKDLFKRKNCLEAGEINTILKAKVPVSSVNWPATILNFYFYSYMRNPKYFGNTYGLPPELEIRIKKNAQVEILDIE